MTQEKSILVVEDDAEMRQALVELLGKNYSVLTAACAEDALKILEEGKTTIKTLILLDIRMPGMGGLAFLSHLKEKKFYNRVIMVTAYDELENWASSLLSFPEVIGFMVKPFSNHELLEVINLFFQGREQEVRDLALTKLEDKLTPEEKKKMDYREKLKDWLKGQDLTDKGKTEPHLSYLKYL